MPQEQFLSNYCNEERLIAMLGVKLKSEGFSVQQATEDADHLIVITAIAAAEEQKCAVLVEEDISFLIILSPLDSSSEKKIFLNPGKGNSQNNHFFAGNFKHSQ
ncbi:hypothetical protein AVEN_227750-1 [Araneus ventricosus]|uniref:DUF5615 domain-containing protein n=1 Tax=Araneus ventricosus TaxID=182803 RepID=A0A4Y2LP93_ARAVE|nr:hypothetical protein AVEN_227750-1 [Araneus ventricosus]